MHLRTFLPEETALSQNTLQIGIQMVSTLVTLLKTTKEDMVIVWEDIATQDYHNSIKTLKVVVLKELIQEIIGLFMIPT